MLSKGHLRSLSNISSLVGIDMKACSIHQDISLLLPNIALLEQERQLGVLKRRKKRPWKKLREMDGVVG